MKRELPLKVYLLTREGSGLGVTYTAEYLYDRWATVVLKRGNTVVDHQRAFSGETLYKVTMQTPLEPLNLELTRLEFTRQNRTITLQPVQREYTSSIKPWKCIYWCRQVSDVEVD